MLDQRVQTTSILFTLYHLLLVSIYYPTLVDISFRMIQISQLSVRTVFEEWLSSMKVKRRLDIEKARQEYSKIQFASRQAQ
jgi:hypothetical protein